MTMTMTKVRRRDRGPLFCLPGNVPGNVFGLTMPMMRLRPLAVPMVTTTRGSGGGGESGDDDGESGDDDAEAEPESMTALELRKIALAKECINTSPYSIKSNRKPSYAWNHIFLATLKNGQVDTLKKNDIAAFQYIEKNKGKVVYICNLCLKTPTVSLANCFRQGCVEKISRQRSDSASARKPSGNVQVTLFFLI